MTTDQTEKLIVYGWGTHNLAQFSACSKRTDPALFAVLKACLATIKSQKLKQPSDHRALVFDPTGSEYLGTWGAKRTDEPSRQKLSKAAVYAASRERTFPPRKA